MLPLPKARDLASFIGSLFLTPSNSVRPLPTTSGLSTIWYSSINPASANCATTLPLPMITMFGPGSCFSLRTSVVKSPFNSVVLFHETLSNVVENTNFRRLFIRSTTIGLLWAARGVGQKLAIRSYRSEQELAAAAGVLRDKGLPLRIILVGPAHVTLRVSK